MSAMFYSSKDAIPFHQSKKFIVFEECLMSLFQKCHKCGNESVTVTSTVIGTFLSISQECANCLLPFKWDSQPMVDRAPAGNILMSAAILLSGSLPTKVLRMLKIYGCACFSRNTFFRHQEEILQPCVFSVWKDHQSKLFKQLRQEKRPLVLGGDGRADSPGHSAKFGSYTMMELKKKAVIDIQLVQVHYCYNVNNGYIVCCYLLCF